MWKYVKRYLPFAILAAMFMMGEVLVDLIQPSLMSKIVDDGVLGLNNGGTGNLNIILTTGLTMIAIVIIGGLCGSLNNVFVHKTAQNVGNEIRKDSLKKIMKLSYSQMDKFGTGSIVTRVTNDITQVQTFVSVFIRGMIRTLMLTGGSIFCMFQLNTRFGLIVLIAFPFIIGCMFFCLAKANPLFPKLQAQLDEINNIMQEDISGIRIIKACVKECYEKIRFGKANDTLIKTQLRTLILFAFMNPIINFLMYIVVVAILLVGNIEISNGTSPGTIMAAVTYTTQLLNGILLLVMLFQNISRGSASWKRVNEILITEPELKDGSFDEETKIKGKIEFKNVSFSYPGTNQLVLNHINFTINPGETVAIMGATGSGKTTLCHLIPRFYDVTKGSVYVDDIDVREYKQKTLRDKISITLQKTELFNTTIKENIAWGKENAIENEILNAAKIAQADEFISKTPLKYDTLVAERGMSLSGGQKQRLSIARTLLKESEILIFDDSTSALDFKTEANLYKALNKQYPKTTKIIIAGRISSVQKADKIIVLNNGKIDACGTHLELLKNCDTYKEIYESQIGEEGEV